MKLFFRQWIEGTFNLLHYLLKQIQFPISNLSLPAFIQKWYPSVHNRNLPYFKAILCFSGSFENNPGNFHRNADQENYC